MRFPAGTNYKPFDPNASQSNLGRVQHNYESPLQRLFQLCCASKVASASWVWRVAFQVAGVRGVRAICKGLERRDHDQHFDKVCERAPSDYQPFWIHPDICDQYRFEVQVYGGSASIHGLWKMMGS